MSDQSDSLSSSSSESDISISSTFRTEIDSLATILYSAASRLKGVPVVPVNTILDSLKVADSHVRLYECQVDLMSASDRHEPSLFYHHQLYSCQLDLLKRANELIAQVLTLRQVTPSPMPFHIQQDGGEGRANTYDALRQAEAEYQHLFNVSLAINKTEQGDLQRKASPGDSHGATSENAEEDCNAALIENAQSLIQLYRHVYSTSASNPNHTQGDEYCTDKLSKLQQTRLLIYAILCASLLLEEESIKAAERFQRGDAAVAQLNRHCLDKAV